MQAMQAGTAAGTAAAAAGIVGGAAGGTAVGTAGAVAIAGTLGYLIKKQRNVTKHLQDYYYC